MKYVDTAGRKIIRVLGVAAFAALSLGLTTIHAQTAVAPVYVAPPPSSWESGRDVGFYLDGDLGASILPSFQSSRLGFPGNFSTHPGVRLDVEPGYNFLATGRLTLGGEFETGFIANRLSSVNELGSPFGGERGDYYQVPLLANLVLRLHPDSFVTPYIGVGGGGDFSRIRLNQPGFYGYEARDNEIDPAAQAKGGVNFRLASNIDLGVGYKFLADFPSEGRYIATHAAEATVTVRF